jgi:predicted nucleotidyltransferase
MTQQEILTQIRSDLSTLKSEFGVNNIGLFGSYARKHQSIESDLDFLVDLNPPYAKHYFDLLFFLEKKFDKKVDLVRRGQHLTPKFLSNIEKEIIYV